MRHEIDHYFPVLRDKPAERDALAQLPSGIWPSVSPIVELIPKELIDMQKGNVPPENFFIESAARIRACCETTPYVDIFYLTGFLSPNAGRMFHAFIEYSLLWRFDFIPILRLNSKSMAHYFEMVRDYSKESGVGVAIRLRREEVNSRSFSAAFDKLVNDIGFMPDQIDIIYDSQVVKSSNANLLKNISRIPNPKAWRNLVYLGGSFPVDLSDGFVVGDNIVPRKEWVNWQEYANNKPDDWHIGYGDYAIQHPIYSMEREAFLPSPSVRYATEENWLVMKGLKRDGPPQYMAHAQVLISNPAYKGPGYSPGDEFIMDKARQLRRPLDERKPGTPTSWLTAGINHQLVLVVQQVREVAVTKGRGAAT